MLRLKPHSDVTPRVLLLVEIYLPGESESLLVPEEILSLLELLLRLVLLHLSHQDFTLLFPLVVHSRVFASVLANKLFAA